MRNSFLSKAQNVKQFFYNYTQIIDSFDLSDSQYLVNKENRSSNFLKTYSSFLDKQLSKKTIDFSSSFGYLIENKKNPIKVRNQLFTNYMKNSNSINKKISHINDSCFGKKNRTFSFINSPPFNIKYQKNSFKKEITSFSPTSYKRNINYYFLTDIMRFNLTFDKMNLRRKQPQIKIVPAKEIKKKKEKDNNEKFFKDLEIPKENTQRRNLTTIFF